jgi:hypothetical protein
MRQAGKAHIQHLQWAVAQSWVAGFFENAGLRLFAVYSGPPQMA